MKKFFLLGAIALVTLVVVVTLLVGNLNTLVKKGVESMGPKVLKAQVSLEAVDIDLSSGAGTLQGLIIGNPEGFKSDYALQAASIRVEIDPASLTADKIHIRQILITSPDMIYEGLVGKNNLEQLEINSKNFIGAHGKPGQKTDAAGKKVRIDTVRIEKGSISVSPSLLQGKALTIPLPPIELHDIGKKKDATMADALQEVLSAINRSALPAVQDGLAAVGQGVKDIGSAISEGAGKGIDSIKGLFSK